jgi:hypothetical protein
MRVIGYKQGAVHTKIIFSNDEQRPFLLEGNGCCQPQDGSWISLNEECIGYSQVEIALSTYVRPDR